MKEKITNILKEYYQSLKSNNKVSISNKINFQSEHWFEIADKILENTDILSLYPDNTNSNSEKINLIKIRFCRLKSKKYLNYNIDNIFEKIKNGLYINNKYKENICLNVKKFNFISLYPNIIEILIDNDILNINNKNYYFVFKYFKNNKNEYIDSECKYIINCIINYFFGILNHKSLYSSNFENFFIYRDIIYNQIKDKLKNDLIYLDTDMFFFYDNNYNFNFKLQYYIDDVQELIVFRNKKYIEKCDNIINYHGFRFYEKNN